VTFLIDTHALLWYFSGSSEISETAADIIAAPENDIAIHAASLWEIAIKASIGKLRVHVPTMMNRLEPDGIRVIPLTSNAILAVADLPFPTFGKSAHKDPFDRIIAATMLANPEYKLISCDAVFDLYGIVRTW
jgi:PIN domain nuclease of toxin-antitoxin system